MGRSARRVVVVTVLVAGAAACGLFPDLGGLEGDASDDVAVIDATKNEGGADVIADAPVIDAPNDVIDASAGDGGCPSGRGPSMVKLDPKTCIDSTEVTVAQYRVFFNSNDAGSITQIPECGWNTTLTPANGMPGTPNDLKPIGNINWCQAQAFCAWAGKSLCGAPEGGSYTYVAFGSASASTWMNACSANGTQSYPYGASFDASACNLATFDASVPIAPAGSSVGCQGSVPGLFDMIGNVTEWDNACLPSGTDASTDLCRRRGSDVGDQGNPALKTCGWDESDPRSHQSYTTGARCCAYLP
ncbi:MAG TPA: SUMF1/EgtB/PvdO family nonheme iron enzyme [Polyangiaceae bacterium]